MRWFWPSKNIFVWWIPLINFTINRYIFRRLYTTDNYYPTVCSTKWLVITWLEWCVSLLIGKTAFTIPYRCITKRPSSQVYLKHVQASTKITVDYICVCFARTCGSTFHRDVERACLVLSPCCADNCSSASICN